jgi:hypothetical protein
MKNFIPANDFFFQWPIIEAKNFLCLLKFTFLELGLFGVLLCTTVVNLKLDGF